MPDECEATNLDESMTFELEAEKDGVPLAHKVEALKKEAAFRWLNCTGVMHPSTRSVTVTFSPKPLPPTVVRIRLIIKNALRTHGLRNVVKEAEHATR